MNAENLVQELYERGARLSVRAGKLAIEAPPGALDAALTERLRLHKEAILSLVAGLEGATGAAAPAAERPEQYEHPAAPAQQRMLFLEELADGRSYYNIPFACRLEGELDTEALRLAICSLLRSHDVLRTVYPLRGDSHVQSVRAVPELALARQDLRMECDPAQALAQALAREAEYRFDLTAELPLRCALYALEEQVHVLSMNIHHIAADGHSMRRLLADLGQAYRHHRLRAAGEALPRGRQYADYASWQAEWRGSDAYRAARDYWLTTMRNSPALHGILGDAPRSAATTVAGSHYRAPMPGALAQAIAGFARACGTTPFAVYQAGFAALLARYSGEHDIVFGTAAANRVPAEFADTVGLFVNTLALRYQVGEDASFRQLVQQAATVTAGALRHQAFAFDELVDALQPRRDASYNPLVQVLLVMQDDAQRVLQLDGLEVRFLEQDQQVSKFDFALHVRSGAGGIVLDWEYNTGLFHGDTMAQMSRDLVALLEAGMADADAPLASVVLAAAQPAVVSAAAPLSAHLQFALHAQRDPLRTALIDGVQRVSYGELAAMAERVARRLAAGGAGRGTHVGVCLERSVELVAAMLGIYQLGAVYVPLDPHYPQARLAFMAADSGMRVLLADPASPAVAGLDPALPVIDAARACREDCPAQFDVCTDASAVAYVIYTSGSTGKPKGVLVTQSNLFHSLEANRAAMQVTAQDVLPTIGSQAFGVSLLEILLPLTSGGAVQLVGKAQVADIDELVRSTAGVTVLHAVPSVMRHWLEAVVSGRHADPYPALRLLLVGGESVPDILLQRIKQWRPQLRLLELYGMTESTIVCSRYEATGAPGAHYCIGRPYAHAAFHVLNASGQEQPLGVPGELHIGGPAIAAGYLGQPELTRERFLPNPFAPGERLYRTGDRVRRLADGHYEFLGRVDHQVSLRGARIELGEVETLANGAEGVNQAVAHVVEQADGDAMLVLFYTCSLEGEARRGVADAIRARLASGLPDYMQPSVIQCLERFPLNPNGKVDRKQLPAPALQEERVAPATDTERTLLALAWEVLQRDDFGVSADFFEIGGHSLAAAKLVARIRTAFGISFPLAALYSAPTVRSCAAVVEAALLERFAAQLKVEQGAAAPQGDGLLI